MIQDLTAGADAYAKGERESLLERRFGKLEEFDKYAEAFTTLASVGGAAWDSLYESITRGESLSGAAIRKAIGAALGYAGGPPEAPVSWVLTAMAGATPVTFALVPVLSPADVGRIVPVAATGSAIVKAGG